MAHLSKGQKKHLHICGNRTLFYLPTEGIAGLDGWGDNIISAGIWRGAKQDSAGLVGIVNILGASGLQGDAETRNATLSIDFTGQRATQGRIGPGHRLGGENSDLVGIQGKAGCQVGNGQRRELFG